MTPRKPNQPTLTREQIVSAAIGLVDRDGLSGLSMRRLATELGMSPMSLYYHVPDKSALYDLILDAVMSEVDMSGDDPTKPIEERLIHAAYAFRAALVAHPNTVILALSRSLHTDKQLVPIDAILGLLFEAGLSSSDAMACVNIVGQFVLGATAAAAAGRMAGAPFRDAAHEPDYSAVTAETHPHMARAASEADYAGYGIDFDRGLRALVHGLLRQSAQEMTPTQPSPLAGQTQDSAQDREVAREHRE